MGQKFRDDKIGTLSHSGGSIVMSASTSNPAYVTIGGQQWKVTSSLSRTIATDVTMAANTLYMIYAVRNSGNTELRISTNVNSVGPAGFSSWKLVGAFQSNGMSPIAFGSFVTIEGTPTSGFIPFQPVWTATGSNPVIGNGTLAGSYRLSGNLVEMTIRTTMNTTTTYGSGQYMWSIPFNLDTSIYVSGYQFSYSYGQATYLRSGVQTYDGGVCAPADFSANKVSMQYQSANTYVNPTTPNTFGNGDEIFGHAFYPGVGLSNIPLKDR